MSKVSKFYIIVIILLLAVVLCLLQARVVILQEVNAVKLEPSLAITIWAAVLTIVFLIFSLLGLINIDHKLSALDKTKSEMQETSIEMREQLINIKTSAAEERDKIIKGAEAELKKIIKESNVRQEVFDALGRIAADPSPDKQEKGYAEVLKLFPDLTGVNYALIHIRRGDSFLTMRNYEKALSEYEKAVELSPKDALCYRAIGYLYVQQKKYPQSINYYLKALELEPDNDITLMNIGTSYAAQGLHDEAKKYFDRALTVNPDIAEAYYNKSQEYVESKDPMKRELMRHYIDHCLELNPLFYKARIGKASSYKDQGKYDQAIDECNKVITEGSNDDYVWALIERGHNYLKLNLHSLALLSFQHAFFLDPNNVEILHNLAVAHLGLFELYRSYQYILQAYFEAERQNDHYFDEAMKGLLAFIYNNYPQKLPYGPDNIKEYVAIRLKSQGE